MASDIHRKLKRVRKPRVRITYETPTCHFPESELPFVVGVLGDFSGNPTQPLKPLSERKFIEIDRDNFNQVMAQMSPGVNFSVENLLLGDGSEIAVQLEFNSIEDFEPAKIVSQVKPLRELLELRKMLGELLTCVNSLEQLEDALQKKQRIQAFAERYLGAQGQQKAGDP